MSRHIGRALLLCVAALGLGSLTGSCETQPAESTTGTVTATITLDRERIVAIDSIVPLEILGRASLDEIRIELAATVTATSVDLAEAQLQEVEIRVNPAGEDPNTVHLLIEHPPEGKLTGQLSLKMPADMIVQGIARAGAIVVDGMQNDLDLVAQAGAEVIDARANVKVAIQRGDAIVDSRVAPGTELVVETGSGNIELRLPRALSASLEASTERTGEVFIQHPSLPPPLGANTTNLYRTTVSGGLALVRALTQQGNIFIGTR